MVMEVRLLLVLIILLVLDPCLGDMMLLMSVGAQSGSEVVHPSEPHVPVLPRTQEVRD